jgi:hypothetical protein
MAVRLGVRVGTIKSRASALARQGKLQARPRGGASPRQRAQQRVELLPPQVDAGTNVHPPVHTVQTVQAQLYAPHSEAHNDLSPEDRESEHWNIYMPRWLRQRVEAEATPPLPQPSAVRRGEGVGRAPTSNVVMSTHRTGAL